METLSMKLFHALSVLIVLLLVACGPAPRESGPDAGVDAPRSQEITAEPGAAAPRAAAEPVLEVATLSSPADYLVARLAGPHVERRLVAPAGEDPPFWQPPAEVIVSLQGADLIVMNGAGYEAWTAQASLPLSRLVASAEGLDLLEVEGRTHSHGSGGEHSHAGLDPHTWMDPELYAQQARRVHQALKDALAEALGDGAAGDDAGQGEVAAALDAELARLESELGELAADYRRAAEPLAGIEMAANHPSFAYLARRFGLEIEVLDLDPSSAPGASRRASFERWAEGRDAPILLWEEPPSEAARAGLPAEVHHVYLDPLEQPVDGEYDYLARARANVERLADLATWAQEAPAP